MCYRPSVAYDYYLEVGNYYRQTEYQGSSPPKCETIASVLDDVDCKEGNHHGMVDSFEKPQPENPSVKFGFLI